MTSARWAPVALFGAALGIGLAGASCSSGATPATFARIAPGAPVDIPIPPSMIVAPSVPTDSASSTESKALPTAVQAGIDKAVSEGIAESKIPGCVVMIGRHDSVLVAKAYGSRALQPAVVPMEIDTVFDLASLTKPLATASSVLVLADRGKVDLEAPLNRYLPELGEQGRGTVRQALTHTAGFVADTPIADYAKGMPEALRRIARFPLRYSPGTDARYSDVGFLVLGELVRRVSGRDLATFSRDEVFAPLGMTETGFLPPDSRRGRAAPTEFADGHWLQGEVHDPRARALGGVSGHAGVFSTAADLSLFAQALLGHGSSFLSPRMRDAYLAPNDIPRGVRALGWDVRSAYSTNRGTALSPRAFGHGGYTGTSLWIDPEKDLFVVVLSNRVHPNGHGEINPLAGAIADLAASAVGIDERRTAPSCETRTSVRTGLEVLIREKFTRLAGAHVGLITNAAGRTRDGARDVDLFASADNVKLEAIFAPEHGLETDQDAVIKEGRDAKTGLPVYSLYGDHFTPTDAELAGIDTLVFNLPDVGARFFTYASTMHRALAAAAKRGIRFVVLDRPNPIDGIHVEGPVLSGTHSFVNHAALPVRHGMTIGELALLLNADDHLGVNLEVVRMAGWSRESRWSDTGLPWLPPSPNLRDADEALLYPGVALLEASNVSVGRGTDKPFEVLGAPWIDRAKLAESLTRASLPGVRFESTTFTPTSSRFHGEACNGVKLTITDPNTMAPVTVGIAIAVALHQLYPSKWDSKKLTPLLEAPDALNVIERGGSVAQVLATWSASLSRFATEREKYFLYPRCVATKNVE